MKNRFQRMNKEEQAKAIEEYNTNRPDVAPKYKRLRIVCIFGMIWAVCSLVWDMYSHFNGASSHYIESLIIDCFLLVFCVVGFIASKTFLEKSINSYLVEKLRQEQINKWAKEKEIDEKQKKKESKKNTTKETKKVVKKAKVKKDGKTTKSNS